MGKKTVSAIMSIALALCLGPTPAAGDVVGTAALDALSASGDSRNIAVQSWEAGSTGILSISAGSDMSAVVRDDGTLWTWGSSKKLSVNKKSGKVTIQKGTGKGTYEIKVKVRAAGNNNYKLLVKAVAVKVKVK